MIKNLRSFSFLSFLIFVGHESLGVEYQNKYYRKNFYGTEKRECVCSCHDFRGFSGLQVFFSESFILNHKNLEISAARFIHPNLYCFSKAYHANKKIASKGIPNYYKQCFSAVPSWNLHCGGSLGLRYMWGGHKRGYALYVSVGKRELFDLTLKTGAGETMKTDLLTSRGLSESQIQTIEKVRNELEKKSFSENDNYYKIPEHINCTTWNIDILLELRHCFIGDMLKTEELHREKFCLIGSYGFGARVNFLTKVSDNMYSVAPKENEKFLKKNVLPVCPLLRLGLQGLFKSGFFVDFALLAQILTIPGILQIPIPCSTFGLKDFSSIEGNLKNDYLFLFNINPEINISFGYDFYGLCVGKKLEDYYDN